MVLITAAYTLGILFGKITAFPLWLDGLFLIIFAGLILFAYLQKITFSYLLLILCFIVGVLNFSIRSLPAGNDISAFADKGYLTLTGQVDDQPRIKDNGVSFPFKVEQVDLGRKTIRTNGNIYVSIPANALSLQYGERVIIRGRLSPFQNYSNPLMQAAGKAYGLNASFLEKLPGTGGHPLKKATLWFSERFNAVLLKILPQKEASLLGSVLLGTSVSPLPQDLKDNYRKAGLIHLLVVSGTQVSILIGVCLSITRILNLPLWLSILITSCFNFLLTVVAGAGASILRAAIRGEITLLGLLFEREKEFYTALAVSALALLIVDPLSLFDIGFQLSFAATWSLVYVAPVLEKKMPAMLAISLGPILVTSPIIAFYFSQVSLGALVSNLLVLPWVEFMVILGFLTTILGFIFLPLAQVLGGTIWLMLTVLDWIAKIIASFPGACFYILAPNLFLMAGYYAALIIFVELLRKDDKLKITAKRIAFALFLFAAVFVWSQLASATTYGSKELTVTFLDVGQGDSILLEVPDGKKILIDGGGVEPKRGGEKEGKDAVGEKVVVPFLHRKGINSLDMVILTHPHADHLGGLNKVLEEIKVDAVLDSGQVYASRAYQRFKALVAKNQIKYTIARAGQTIAFNPEIKGLIFNPVLPFLTMTNSDPNNNSIVLRLVYGQVSFMLTGDMEKEGEERVLGSGFGPLTSTVLKVGHHGSNTSTSDEFLRRVNPQAAVISVGKNNRYRHPRPETLDKLQKAGVKLYRTDENGAVTVRTDGQTYTIETQL